MAEDSQPITNLEQAKSYFIQMGCSHFHLDREDFQRRDEYYALDISAELEAEWCKEEFEYRLANYKSVDPKDLGWSYSSLCGLAREESYHLDRLLQLTRDIEQWLPLDQIGLVLNNIVGNDNSKAHGGLIEKSYLAFRSDLAEDFAEIVKSMLQRIDDANIPLTFVRGHFADVIKHFRINKSRTYIRELIRKDHADNFQYFKNDAEEGNLYAMRMLAQHYIKGWGCKADTKQAKFWLSRAVERGDVRAKKALKKLKFKFWL